MKNKKWFLALAALLVVTTLTTGCGQKAELKDGSQVAVKLDGIKITADEYYNEIKGINIATLVDMIDHQLFDKKYGKTDEENDQVEEQLKSLKDQYGSNEDTYNAVLRQYFGVQSEDELEDMLRLEFRRNAAINDFIEKNIKDKEIEKYYENDIYGEVKASHILITPSVSEDATTDEKKKAEDEALKEAKKIIKELKNGKKFADLAKKYSKDEASASNGGDLGYFDLNEMVDEFSDAVKELKVDEYTKEPVKSSFGYHIILKTGEKEKPKLKDVKDKILETLREEKLNEDPTLYYKALVDIREEKNIKWKDDEIKKQYNKLMDQLIESAKEQNQQ
mgnify:CR=1 FL=1